LNESKQPFVYRSQWQYRVGATTMVVRVEADPLKAIALVRRELQQLDPNMPISSARTLVERLSLPLLPARIVASALGGFGLVALLLAAIGIYGVMSYAVSRRTREIGVRMALGATAAAVHRLIVSQGARVVLIGVVIGVGVAFMSTRLLGTLLFGVKPVDPIVFAAMSLMMLAIGFLASYVPARRASSVAPIESLRSD
jgi:ABC-type antimicrobial peptide transport system permease subunit